MKAEEGTGRGDGVDVRITTDVGGMGEREGRGEKLEAGLAGNREGGQRPCPSCLHSPCGLPAWNLAQGPDPASMSWRLLIQPVCSAEARAGGREAQRLQGQEG